MRKWVKRSLGALLGVTVLLVGFALLLVSTEWGTQWLVARSKPYLPPSLALDGVAGTLLSEISVDQLRWQDDSTVIAVDDVLLEVDLLPFINSRVAIRSLTADRVQVESTPPTTGSESDEPIAVDLPVTITIDAASIRNIDITTADGATHLDRIELAGEAGGETLNLNLFLIESDWLNVEGKIRAQLSPPFSLTAYVEWALENQDSEPLAGSLQVSGDQQEYQIEHDLELPVEVRTEGTLLLDGNVPKVDLDNQWSALEWPVAENQMLTSSGGNLNIAGELNAYRIAGDAAIQMGKWPDTMISIRGGGSTDEFELGMLDIESDLANLSASGSVNWREQPRWTIRFGLTQLDVSQFSSEMTGRVNADGVSTGQLSSAAEVGMELRIDKLSGTLNTFPIDGTATISALQGTIDIVESSVSVLENEIEAHGRIAPEIDLALTWDVPRIVALLPEATGQTHGDAQVQNSEAGWSISGNVTATSVTWDDYAVGSITAGGDASTYGSSDLSVQFDDLSINEQAIKTFSGRISGTPDSHRIDINATANERTVSALAEGDYRKKSWSGELKKLEFADGDRSEWHMVSPAALQLASTGITLDLICIEEATSDGRLCARAESLEDGMFKAEATLEQLPLTLLPLSMLAEGIDVAGSLDADLDLDWQDSQLNASVSVSMNDASFTADYEGETVAAALQYGLANIKITNNVVAANADIRLVDGGSATASLDINDVTDGESGIDGTGSVELTDLSFVPLFIPAVSNTRGRLDGTLTIGGELDAPTMGGVVRLSDGAFRATSAGVDVTDIGVELRQDVNGRLSLTGAAKSGEGNLSVTGDSRIDPQLGLATSVKISGENFEFIRLPEWQAVASPDIDLTMDNESATLRGQFNVPSARINLNTLPETAESVSPDTVVHGRDGLETQGERRFDIDVTASLGDDVNLSGFGLDTGLTGSLRLRGGSQEPFIGTGRIDLRNGRYTAYGQELEIESGALLFSGPLENPALDIRAIRKVDNVVAVLNVSGTPNNLRSTVSSEPSLSDAEALSYLIAGRPLATSTEQDSNRVGQAAFALGLTGANKVIAQLQSKWGLESLSLDGDGDDGRIVAGRRIGGRLLVEYGYGLVDRLGTLLLRYQLNDRIVVETTTGTANTLDVVYSVKKE